MRFWPNFGTLRCTTRFKQHFCLFVYVHLSVSQEKSMIGYCPQVDALCDFMTAYETLKYMAMIRGIPWSKIHTETDRWLKSTDLNEYRNRLVSTYSGGTKRKLNTALAMVCLALLCTTRPVSIWWHFLLLLLCIIISWVNHVWCSWTNRQPVSIRRVDDLCGRAYRIARKIPRTLCWRRIGKYVRTSKMNSVEFFSDLIATIVYV